MVVASLEPISQCRNIVFWAQPRSCCGMFKNWKVPFPYSGLRVPGLDFALTSVLNFLFSLPVLQLKHKGIFSLPIICFGVLVSTNYSAPPHPPSTFSWFPISTSLFWFLFLTTQTLVMGTTCQLQSLFFLALSTWDLFCRKVLHFSPAGL